MSGSWSKCFFSSLLVASLCPGASGADERAPAPPLHGEPSALAGHDAEAKARDPADESRRELLFFTLAAREIGEPGVDCGHRAGRRPDTIAGTGGVVVVIDRRLGRPILRRWLPPDPNASGKSPDLRSAGADVLKELGSAGRADLSDGLIEIDATTFAWCR